MIELLVVVSILAVMASILLPALSWSREAASRALCANCLRQQSAGLYAYASDWHDQFPPTVTPAYHGDWPFGAMVLWYGAVPDAPGGTPVLFATNYIKNAHIFYCPSQTHVWINYEDSWRPQRWTDTYISYPSWIGFRQPYADPTDTMASLVADSPRSPGNRIVASDLITSATNADTTFGYNNHHLANIQPAGGNILLNDGSVTWRDYNQTQPRIAFGGGGIDFDFRF